MTTFRAFQPTDEEYAAVIAIDHAVWPEYPSTVAEWRHNDESRDPQYLYERYVAERAGEIVAVGVAAETFWSHKPGKYYLGVDVHPEQQRQGIGSAFYDFLRARLDAFDPALVQSDTREDKADSLRFLANRGFGQVQREPISRLELADFDPAPFAHYAAQVAEQGIQIHPLAELIERVPDWQRRYYDVHWEALRDVPSPDPITRSTFEVFLKRSTENPNFMPEGCFIALDGEEWVGLSQLWKSQADQEMLHTGLTGVTRSHRRRGLAMAMKLRALEAAAASGAIRVETDNDENNPMYQINLRLGFKPEPAWLSFHLPIRALETESDGATEPAGSTT